MAGRALSRGRASAGLWRNQDFLRLWAAETIAQSGAAVTLFALPLVAVVTLEATPFQMGLLTALGSVPALVIGLPAGVWVDRLPRRHILVVLNVSRAGVLFLIPMLHWLGRLRIEQLYVVAVLLGLLTLVFDIAYRSYLPSLIEREQLVDGNSKLEMSRSFAEVTGPSVAGALVHLLTAPVAIAAQSITFLGSAVLVVRIRSRECMSASTGQQTFMHELRDGVSLVFRNPILRALAGSNGTMSAFNAMLEAIFILYLTRELGLSPLLIGLIFSAGSVGFLVGALLPGVAVRALGLGRALAASLVLVALSDLALPLAAGPTPLVVALLIVAQFAFGLGLTIYRVNQVSLRQATTPGHQQGRMNATVLVVTSSVIPAGALLGGILGELIGLRATLLLAVTGELLSIAWILASPIWLLRAHPSPALVPRESIAE